MPKSQQLLNQGEQPSVVLQGFAGLSLKLDLVNRPKNSFQQLDNFDLCVPGSIRKIPPASVYGGPYTANLLNCIEYLAQPNNPQGGIRRIIAVGADGKLYDVVTGLLYSDTSALLGTPPTVPFMLQYSGYYVPFNIRAWQASTAYALNDAVLGFGRDGNVYVFVVTTAGTSNTANVVVIGQPIGYGEPPIWPTSGSVTDGSVVWTNVGKPTSTRFLANFLSIVVPGKQPIRINEWQYDPTNVGESPKVTIGQMGVSAPEVPIGITSANIVVTPNLNGYAPSAGRAYLWTLYNPQTLQESSPSPFVGRTQIYEIDSAGRSVTINGSILLPLPPPTKGIPFQSYQSYALYMPVSALTPAIGQGYTQVRVYATKDGAANFFLVQQLYDGAGNLITDANGGVSITQLIAAQAANSYFAYIPIPGSQNVSAVALVFEGSGFINLAPDPVNLGSASWSAGVGTGIQVVSDLAPDGADAFEYIGTGGAASLNTYRSSAINVQHQQYYFQAYIDNSAGTGGAVTWKVMTLGGTVLLTLTQVDGAAGVLSGTFTPSVAQKQVKIVVSITGTTVASGNSVLWANPQLYVGGSLPTIVTNYPTPDASLIVPAPLPFTNNPPPVAAMAEILNDSLHLVDNNDQTRIWYSQQGQYEKFGLNAFVRTTVTKNADQILEVIKCFDRILVGKGRSVEQITTYPPQTPVPVDPQHGVLARRATITWGSSVLGILTNGLGQVNLAASIQEDRISVGMAGTLFGDDVKPLIDSINPATLRATNTGSILPCPAIYNKLDMFLLAYSVGSGYADNVLMYFLGRSGRGFSRITALPNNANIITLKEIQDPASGDYFLLALTNDAKTYKMFGGTQDGTVMAVAVTQPLPTPSDIPEEYWDTDKSFEYLYVEGQDISNYQISTSLDGGTTFNTPQALTKKFRVGRRGKSLVIKLTHATVTSNTPLISYMKLSYGIVGLTNS